MPVQSVKANEVGVTAGSVFEMSWGYDQTNIDYYVVTEVSKSGKSVKIMRIGANVVNNLGSQLEVSPNMLEAYGECGGCGQYLRTVDNGPDAAPSYTHPQRKFDDSGEEQGVECYNGNGVARPLIQTKRLQSYDNNGSARPFLNMTSYANAYLWTGGTSCATAPGWGH